MVLYSFGFAPMVFCLLPAEETGRFIRAAFRWYYLFVIVSAGLGGLVLFLTDVWSGWLMIVIAGVGVFSRQGLMPRINAARDMWVQGSAEAKSRC